MPTSLKNNKLININNKKNDFNNKAFNMNNKTKQSIWIKKVNKQKLISLNSIKDWKQQ